MRQGFAALTLPRFVNRDGFISFRVLGPKEPRSPEAYTALQHGWCREQFIAGLTHGDIRRALYDLETAMLRGQVGGSGYAT